MAKGPKPKPLSEKLRNYKLGGPDGECWEWQGSINPVTGYGTLWFEGTTQSARRASCKYHNPEQNPEGLLVLHSCDNRRCINPAHLSFGTSKQNAREAVERGGMKTGEDSHSSKLTQVQVTKIRELIKQGLNLETIGNMYGVTHSTISLIKRGKRWRSSL